MEKFQEACEKADKCLKIADHMLFVTYPLVKDDKLLMAILENLFLAFSNSMAALLYYERLFKRIPPFHDTFDSKFNLFVEKMVPKYRLDKRFIQVISQVKDMVAERKQAPVEFTRRGKFVICTQNYKLRTLSVEQLKQFVAAAKEFIKLNNRIINQNAYIFE